jgi:AcrR family transcriptional regulator
MMKRTAPQPSDAVTTDIEVHGVAAIFSAARSEFGRFGMTGTRIEDIARRCGKTRQLIYHYYESKENLFAEVVWDSLQRAMADMLSEDYDRLETREALARFLSRMADQYRQNPDWVSIMLDENIQKGVHIASRARLAQVTQPVVRAFERILQRGGEEGIFRQCIDVDKMFAGCFAILTAPYLTGDVFSAILTIDVKSEQGLDEWRDFAITQAVHMIWAA